MSGNRRVGFEAQLVGKAIRIIYDLGSSIVTPAKTREDLKLKKNK